MRGPEKKRARAGRGLSPRPFPALFAALSGLFRRLFGSLSGLFCGSLFGGLSRPRRSFVDPALGPSRGRSSGARADLGCVRWGLEAAHRSSGPRLEVSAGRGSRPLEWGSSGSWVRSMGARGGLAYPVPGPALPPIPVGFYNRKAAGLEEEPFPAEKGGSIPFSDRLERGRQGHAADLSAGGLYVEGPRGLGAFHASPSSRSRILSRASERPARTERAAPIEKRRRKR